jgi:protein SCO1/2|tara:strand:- start:4029 stop:4733 length:705 start_codon:yes stop_codon:yes gene_type:complete
MKKSSYLGLIVIVIIFAVIVVPKIYSRLSDNTTVESSRSVKPGFKSLDYIKNNGEPRKVPDFLFLNQDSLYVSNEDYLGKVYVVEFFFTSCPSICPIMNKNMKIINDNFGDKSDFGIASFTIDPEHDTPSVLKSYSEGYVGSSTSWNFLTGPKVTVYDLANNGFNIFAKTNPAIADGFEHSGSFALIDKKGFIRSRQDNYGNSIIYYSGIDEENDKEQGVDMLLNDIELLLNEH